MALPLQEVRCAQPVGSQTGAGLLTKFSCEPAVDEAVAAAARAAMR